MLKIKRSFSQLYATVFTACPWLFASLLGALALPSFAQMPVLQKPAATSTETLPGGMQAITELEGVQELRLPNGMRVLLYPDASKPSVSVNMTVLVGSRHENVGQSGMAHLLEHMLFRGSPMETDPKSALTRRGMRWNATTTVDRTNFYSFFSADAPNTSWYIRWLADILVNAKITESDLAAEMTVVRNELEIQTNDPSLETTKRLNALMYPTHAYGRPVVGTVAQLQDMRASSLKAFYKKYYRTDNTVLIVAGSFDRIQVMNDIANSFGKIAKPDAALTTLRATEIEQDGERSSVVRKAGSVHLAMLGYRAVPAGHPDHLALGIGAIALGLVPSGRLQQAIVDKGLGSRIFATFFPMRESGQLLFGALADGKTQSAVLQQTMIDVVEGLKTNPLTQAEIARAISTLQSVSTLGFTDATAVAQLLSDTSAYGDWRIAFWARQRSAKITPAQVQQAMLKYLLRSNRVSVVFDPGAEQRAPQTMGATLEDGTLGPALAADLNALKTEFATNDVASISTDPLALEQKITRKNLTPNIIAAWLPKPSKGSLVQARIRLNYGDAKSAAGNAVLARAMGDLMLNGTRTQSWEKIQDKFVQLQSVIAIASDTTAVSASLIAPRANLQAALTLLEDVLRHPSFPNDRVEQYKRERITVLNEESNDPSSVTLRELLRHDQPYRLTDARYRQSVPQEIESVRTISPERLRQYHQSMISARTMQVAVVGDFDVPQLEQHIVKLFGTWNTGPAFTRIEEPAYEYRPITIRTQLKDKPNAVIRGGIDVPLSKKNVELAAFEIASHLIGGEFFGELREREGLSYNTSANLAASPKDPLSTLWFEASVPAPKAMQALERMKQILRRMPERAFNDTAVSSVAQELVRRAIFNRADDGAMVNLLAEQLENGDTMKQVAAYEKRLPTVTADEIRVLWKKHIREERYVWAVAGDLP